MSEKLILSNSSSVIKSGKSSSTASIGSVWFRLLVMFGNRKLLQGSQFTGLISFALGPVELKLCPGDIIPELCAGDLNISVLFWLGDSRPVIMNKTIRVKSGIFGQTAKFGQPPCMFHSSMIGIKNKLSKQ